MPDAFLLYGGAITSLLRPRPSILELYYHQMEKVLYIPAKISDFVMERADLTIFKDDSKFYENSTNHLKYALNLPATIFW